MGLLSCFGRRKSKKKRASHRSPSPGCRCSCHRSPGDEVMAGCETFNNYETPTERRARELAHTRKSLTPRSKSLDRGESLRNRDSPPSFMMDVTYVTEKVIVITFPEINSETVYKNDLKEITRMLKTKHGSRYAVFNVSEQRSDLAKLNPQNYRGRDPVATIFTTCFPHMYKILKQLEVADVQTNFNQTLLRVLDFGWPQNLSPPLERICSICKALDAWLTNDPQHVAVLHCKGDKGRIGIVVACYMHYSSICASSDQALDRFAMKRFYDDKLFKTLQPSQNRYINYFKGLLSGSIKMNNFPFYLQHVIVYGVPNFEPSRGCKLYLEIFQGSHLVYTSGIYSANARMERIVVNLDPSLQLCGDVLVKGYHKTQDLSGRTEIFCVQFHTSTLEKNHLSFLKDELDIANYDPRFPDHGRVEFQFSFHPYEYRGNGFVDDAVLLPDSLQAPLVKHDSYDTFDFPTDMGVPHLEGPLDGSLYATVTKRRSAAMYPMPQVPPYVPCDADGAHLSLDSGISSASGLHMAPHSPLPPSLHHLHMAPRSPLITPLQHLHGLRKDVSGLSSLDSRETQMYDVHSYNGDSESARKPMGERDDQSELDEVLNGMIREIQSIPDIQLFTSLRTSPAPPSVASDQCNLQKINSDRQVPNFQTCPGAPIPLPPPLDYPVPQPKMPLVSHRTLPHLDHLEDRLKQALTPQGVYAKPQTLPTSGAGKQPMETRSATQSPQAVFSGSSLHQHQRSSSHLSLDDMHRQRGKRHNSRQTFPTTTSERYEEQPMSWLQRQQQKLKSRKQTKSAEEQRKEQGLLMELQAVQNRRVSGSEESFPVTLPLHIQTYTDGYTSSHSSPPISSKQRIGHKVFSAPTSPVLPPRSSSREITKRVQFWKSGHHPLVRQHSDLSYDRNKPFSPEHHSPTHPPSSSSAAPTTIVTASPCLYLHDHHHQHRSPLHRVEKETRTMSTSAPLPRTHSQDRVAHNGPSVYYSDRRAESKTDLSNFVAGLEDFLMDKTDTRSVTTGSPKLDETGERERNVLGFSHSSVCSPQVVVCHPAGLYRQSTPITTSNLAVEVSPLWSSSYTSSGTHSSSPRTLERPATPAFPVTFVTTYANQEPPDVIHTHPVFVKDSSKFWYKPNISRDGAISMLKDRPPGSFVIRASSSFPGSFGLALKVNMLHPNTRSKSGDISSELVRHFLIEQTPKGVRFKGCHNEPTFGSLSALVYQHSIIPLALPCKLLLPEISSENIDGSQFLDSKETRNTISRGAACSVLYLCSVDMESLTGPQAVRKAVDQTLNFHPHPTPTVVHFKVTVHGITLTDNRRKVFFRRHYPMTTVSHCGIDPEGRYWVQQRDDTWSEKDSFRCFGFVARKPASQTDNQCHVFAELEAEQPASVIVNFINKILMVNAQQESGGRLT